MAALRNTATNIARLSGHSNIAAAQHAAAWSPQRHHRCTPRGLILDTTQAEGKIDDFDAALGDPWAVTHG